MNLTRINLEGFIFSVNGGERVKPHSDLLPENAYDTSWDAETLTLTYYTPAETEEGDPVEHTKTFTEAEIEAAKAVPDELTPPPQSLTRREFHLAAASVGITKEVIGAQIAAIPDATQRTLADIDYRESRDFRRDWPLLASMAGNLGINSDQLDDLFRLGITYRNTPAV